MTFSLLLHLYLSFISTLALIKSATLCNDFIWWISIFQLTHSWRVRFRLSDWSLSFFVISTHAVSTTKTLFNSNTHKECDILLRFSSFLFVNFNSRLIECYKFADRFYNRNDVFQLTHNRVRLSVIESLALSFLNLKSYK